MHYLIANEAPSTWSNKTRPRIWIIVTYSLLHGKKTLKTKIPVIAIWNIHKYVGSLFCESDKMDTSQNLLKLGILE